MSKNRNRPSGLHVAPVNSLVLGEFSSARSKIGPSVVAPRSRSLPLPCDHTGSITPLLPIADFRRADAIQTSTILPIAALRGHNGWGTRQHRQNIAARGGS